MKIYLTEDLEICETDLDFVISIAAEAYRTTPENFCQIHADAITGGACPGWTFIEYLAWLFQGIKHFEWVKASDIERIKNRFKI